VTRTDFRPLAAPRVLLAAAAAALLVPAAWAHVKWFSAFSFADQPLTLGQAITPTVIGLLVLSMVVIGALVWVDRVLDRQAWHRRLDARLEAYRDRSGLVLRVGAGATMLLAWQGDALYVPELEITGAWLGWAQFGVALLLLFRRTVPLAGAAMLLLYAYGFSVFGALHMLDYVFFAGVGFYFLVRDARERRIGALGLPALYLTVGFSLCWVALEKLIYPQWGLYVLSQNPQLALGFPLDFFLTAAAFVEFSLGYLLIICLLQRPLALVITLVFFTTTLVFGKTEVIGHTLIHAALVVFVIEGPGHVWPAPYAFHKRLGLRTAFASVNVALLFALLIVPYALLAWNAYESHVANVRAQLFEVPAGQPLPQIDLAVTPDPHGGFLVRVDVEGFRFPERGAAQAGHSAHGEGAQTGAQPTIDHAHLYVDGEKVGRMYGPVHHLDLPPGTHTVVVALSTADHRMIARGGEVVRARQTVEVP
jgi:hypothetical protein